jgi:hypothetical protein
VNRAVIAVAGAGKTERLAKAVVDEPDPERVLVLTYTTTNQREDAARIAQRMNRRGTYPKVMGWYAFLINEIIRPYLPMLYPDISLHSVAQSDPDTFLGLTDAARYINRNGNAYPSHLGKLALDTIVASNGAAIERVEYLYDRIYIDEAQDLRGNDLCVLERLLLSRIDIRLVLDPCQSTLSTAPRDRKYAKKYENAKIIDLYRQWEKKRLLEIEYDNETHRFTPQIALFSDHIIREALGLERTRSKILPRGHHDGIFLVDKQNLRSYVDELNPTVLAIQSSARLGFPETFNFGKAKGLTRDDILIIATNPIERFLAKGNPLRPKSACGFYVAVTRARYSVAVAVSNPEMTLHAMQSSSSKWRDIRVQCVD